METPYETRVRIACTYGVPLDDVPMPRVIPVGVSCHTEVGHWRDQKSVYARVNAKRMRMRHLRKREGRA